MSRAAAASSAVTRAFAALSLLGVTAWQRLSCRTRGAAATGGLASARELPACMLEADYHHSSCLIALGIGKNAQCACSLLLVWESGSCDCCVGFGKIKEWLVLLGIRKGSC